MKTHMYRILLFLVFCFEIHYILTTPVSLNEIKSRILKKSKGKVMVPKSDLSSTSCRVKTYNITLSHKHCITKTIELNYCYGQCISISFPRDRFYEENLSFCQSCKPKTYKWKNVKIRCPHAKKRKKRKYVLQMIESCACSSC